MLSKNMNYRVHFKKKVLRKIIIESVKVVVALSISILMIFNSYAVALENNQSNADPSFNSENINANKFIYRTYDDETKKRIFDNVIEYEDIEELIHNNNPNIMSMWNSYNRDETASEVYDDYMEAYNNLMAAGDSSESDAVRARMYAQAYSMKMLADNNVNDSVINFWQNEIDEIKLYLDTKKKYINYFISNYNYLVAVENEIEAERVARATETKYQVGVDTAISNLQAKKNSEDAKANLALAESNKNVAEKNFKIACGKSTSDEVSIGIEPNIDVLTITNINLEEGIKKAIENNITLKIYKKSFENANTDEIEKHYNILINYANEEITNDVKNLYSTLQNQNINLMTKLKSWNLLTEMQNRGLADLSNGKISSSDYTTLVHNAIVAKYQVDIQRLNVISAYEDYKYAVDRGIAKAALS